MSDADATEDEQVVLIKRYFGSVGRDVCLCPGFICYSRKNIRLDDQLLCNYNVTILPDVTIGKNVVIAAGTALTKDVPDNCLVSGISAKRIRDIENDVE